MIIHRTTAFWLFIKHKKYIKIVDIESLKLYNYDIKFKEEIL